MSFRYCRPSDIVTGDATITVPAGTVSADSNYGLASLYDGNPARPCKFTGSPVVAVAILFDYGAPQRVDGFVMPAHNLDAAQDVRFQGNAVDAWGAPSVDAAVPIVADDLDGHSSQPWVDVTAQAGYTTAGYRYWRLYIPAGSANPELGEAILVSQWRAFSRELRADLVRTVARGYISSLETSYGVRSYYDQTVKQAQIVGTFLGRDADLTDVRALLDDAGGPVLPFVVIVNSTVQTQGGLLVRCAPSMAQHSVGWYGDDKQPFPVEFHEVSRGLPL